MTPQHEGLNIFGPLPKPKAILFDWDNTLVDTWPVIHAALEETFVAAGLEPWSLEDVKAKVRKSMRDSFPAIFGEDWQRHGETYQNAYRKRQREGIRALEGAEDMVRALGLHPVFVGVVSNKKGAPLRLEAENLGWNSHFRVLIGADDAAKDKPSIDPVLLALKDSGLEPGPHVWFIGDSEIDLETAANAGLTPIYYGPAPEHDEIREGRYGGFPFHAHARNHEALRTLLDYALTQN